MESFTFGLLVDAALKGTLVLLAATGLVVLLRRGSAASRHLIWQMAVLAVLCLPLIKAFSPMQIAILPEFRSPIVEQPAASVVANVEPVTTRKATPASGTVDATSATAATAAPLVLVGALKGMGIVWLVVAAALLLRLALGFVLVRWFALRAYPLYEEGWGELNSELSALVGLKGDVQLYASPHIATPMTWGVARPVVMLPSAAEDWTAERRRVVMLHELAHIRRKDSLTHMVSQIACAVYWFHPLVWKANAHMRAEAERACDDLVLAAGTKPSVYADHLLELVRTIGNMRTPALALPMAQRSTFEGRLLAILEPHIDRTTPRRLSVVGMLVVVGLIVFPLAGLTTANAISTETGPARIGDRMPALHELKSKDDVAAKMADNLTSSDASIMPGMGEFENLAKFAVANSKQKGTHYAIIPLMRALSDADVEVRVEAAQSLGQLDDTVAVLALAKALREDADPRVRKMAAWALGNIESEEGVPALVQALRSDRDIEVRRTSVWALGQIEDASAIPALVDAVRDADAEVRAMSVWAMGQIEDRAAVPALTQVLKGNDVEMKRQAAWALGQIEDVSAVPALAGALRDGDAEVRSQAVWALGQIESPTAVAPLSAFIHDGNSEVRKQVAWALGQIEDAGAVPALSALLRDDKDTEVRQTAAWALGQIEQRPAPQALLDALKDGSKEVRKTAAWALAQIEDPAAAAALRAALKDSDREVRQAVLNALVSLGDQLGYEALAEMMKDADPEVRRAAAAAMGGRHGGHPDPRPQPQPQPRPLPKPIH